MKRLGIILVVLLALVGSLFLGAEPLQINEIFIPGTVSYRIFWELRFPRFLVALVTGGTLALLGGSYQAVFLNPLVEPYILGVSNAVVLGVAIGELFFGVAMDSYGASITGFGLAAVVILSIWFLYQRTGGYGLHRVVLFGMGFQFLLSSLLFFAISYHSQVVGGGNTLRWLFGQIPWISLDRALLLVAICLPFIAAALWFARSLDALSLGDPVCFTMGIDPKKTRALWLLLSSLLVAIIVRFTGTIGFVGLVVPHVTQIIFKPSNHRSLLAISFLLGSLFIVFADVVSRVLIPPYEFPIGILTALIGGPVFLLVLWRKQ